MKGEQLSLDFGEEVASRKPFVPFKMRVMFKGTFACYTNPMTRTERLTYSIPTPSGLRGAVSSIYWHPGIDWVVDKVVVLNKFEFENIKMHEMKDKINPNKIFKEIMTGVAGSCIDNERTLRLTHCLVDVAYLVEFHFREQFHEKNQLPPTQLMRKSIKLMCDKLKKHSCFKQPYLGLRQYPCLFKGIFSKEEFDELAEQSYYKGTYEEFPMLFDGFTYDKYNRRIVDKKFLYNAIMKDGIVDFETLRKTELRRHRWIH